MASCWAKITMTQAAKAGGISTTRINFASDNKNGVARISFATPFTKSRMNTGSSAQAVYSQVRLP